MRLHGIRGSFGSNVLNAHIYITSWSMEINTDVVDVTTLAGGSIGDEVPKDFVAGPTEWNGTWEGFVDSATVVDPNVFIGEIQWQATLGVPVDLAVTPSQHIWQGQVYTSQVTYSVDRFDAVLYTGSFQGTFELTWPGIPTP